MRRMTWLAAALLLAACKDNVAPPAPALPNGDYVLETVNGHPLPQVVSQVGNITESIMGGAVLIRTGSAYVDSTEIQVVSGGSVSSRFDVARGTFTYSNDTVYFAHGSGTYIMVRNGVELTQIFGGTVLVYRR